MKQIVDFAMAIFGTFSTVAQSLIATCLGKVQPALLCSLHSCNTLVFMAQLDRQCWND